jgi:hypothetical protein
LTNEQHPCIIKLKVQEYCTKNNLGVIKMVLASGEKVLKSWKWATGKKFDGNSEGDLKKGDQGEVIEHSLTVTNKRIIAVGTKKARWGNNEELHTTYRDYPINDVQEVYASYKASKVNNEPVSTLGLTVSCIIFAVLAVVLVVVCGILKEIEMGLALFVGLGIIALILFGCIKTVKNRNNHKQGPEYDLWLEFERVREGDREVVSFGNKKSELVRTCELKVDAAVAKEIIESIGALIIAAKEMK